ncbi:MAG TPA: arsenosugar biosynthesis arsenite methyltransferase ArsM, partial [Allocoleopsis sp.]
IPPQMQEMNYGCGTTIHPQEINHKSTVLYVGVGGGLEALQFAYFCRQPGAIIAVDPVLEMREVAQKNLAIASEQNTWFNPNFVDIRSGDALALPVADGTIDIVAQNCLFNIFKPEDLTIALKEAYRVLKPGGKLIMSDPISTVSMPKHLQEDERLRAMCLSGAQTYNNYIKHLVNTGFGQIEIRAKRPYRLLNKDSYNLEDHLLLESLDTVSFKVSIPDDGVCVFTGKTAIYFGKEDSFNDGKGHILPQGIPQAVCDKTAAKLKQYKDILITDSTWHYNGGGCC